MKCTQYFSDRLGDIAIELDAIGSWEITPNADIGLCAHITRKFCKQGRVPEGRVCKLFRDYFVEMGLGIQLKKRICFTPKILTNTTRKLNLVLVD